jgi:anti-sigma factor RsiW
MTTPEDITCRELVELVTAYLDDALEPEDRARFQSHLEICDACRTYVDQMREVVRLSGRVEPEELDPALRQGLLETFRGWKDREPL